MPRCSPRGERIRAPIADDGVPPPSDHGAAPRGCPALAARRGVCAFPAPMSPSRIRMSRVRQAACPAGGFSPMVVERPGDLQLQSGGCRRGLLERFERRIAGLPGGSGPAEYSGRLLPLTSLRAAPDTPARFGVGNCRRRGHPWLTPSDPGQTRVYRGRPIAPKPSTCTHTSIGGIFLTVRHEF